MSRTIWIRNHETGGRYYIVRRVDAARERRTRTALKHLERRARRRAKRAGAIRRIRPGKILAISFLGLSPGNVPAVDLVGSRFTLSFG